MNFQRIIKWFLGVISFLCLLFMTFYVLVGIDIKETLSTNYYNSDQSQIIETTHFKVLTPHNWIHIFHGYGDEANACGSFWTSSGMISYDYGFLTDHYEVDSKRVITLDSLTANRFKIYVAKNSENETGIYIPQQNEMELSFSIFMSKACTENYDDIILAIKNIEFKEFYINWK